MVFYKPACKLPPNHYYYPTRTPNSNQAGGATPPTQLPLPSPPLMPLSSLLLLLPLPPLSLLPPLRPLLSSSSSSSLSSFSSLLSSLSELASLGRSTALRKAHSTGVKPPESEEEVEDGDRGGGGGELSSEEEKSSDHSDFWTSWREELAPSFSSYSHRRPLGFSIQQEQGVFNKVWREKGSKGEGNHRVLPYLRRGALSYPLSVRGVIILAESSRTRFDFQGTTYFCKHDIRV